MIYWVIKQKSSNLEWLFMNGKTVRSQSFFYQVLQKICIDTLWHAKWKTFSMKTLKQNLSSYQRLCTHHCWGEKKVLVSYKWLIGLGVRLFLYNILIVYWVFCSLFQSRCDLEVVFKANHVSVNNEQKATVLVTEELKREFAEFWERFKQSPLQGRNHILSSFCPQVYGLYAVKLAVALILIGGVQRVDASGTRVRGESHLLLVGDPGNWQFSLLNMECPSHLKNLSVYGAMRNWA